MALAASVCFLVLALTPYGCADKPLLEPARARRADFRPVWRKGDKWRVMHLVTSDEPTPSGHMEPMLYLSTEEFVLEGPGKVPRGAPYEDKSEDVLTIGIAGGKKINYYPETLRRADETGSPVLMLALPEFPDPRSASIVRRGPKMQDEDWRCTEEYVIGVNCRVMRFTRKVTTTDEDGNERVLEDILQYWKPGAKWWFYARRHGGGYTSEGWLQE